MKYFLLSLLLLSALNATKINDVSNIVGARENQLISYSLVVGSIKIDKDLAIGLNKNEIYTKEGTTTVANLVRSLQKMSASPKDIISILEAMQSTGSIVADLVVM
jgi:flagellar basal body P-ring protein FlgI